MTRSRPITFLIGAAAVGLIALAAGCGGGSNDTPAASAAPAGASGNAAATVGTANAGGLGTILVDSSGRTLYLFEKDSGTTSACSGACASAWPPLEANGKPTVDSGLDASLVGTTMRSDGKAQVTYNGHPLYLFSGDQAAGDTNGQGSTAFGGSWDVLTPAGDEVTAQASSSSNDAANSGGAAYGGGY
jgi:predicted lipoprotein with Yx(FWY)xxD motif